MFKVQCACGKTIAVRDEDAGRKGKCPHCGQVINLPIPGLADLEAIAKQKAETISSGAPLPVKVDAAGEVKEQPDKQANSPARDCAGEIQRLRAQVWMLSTLCVISWIVLGILAVRHGHASDAADSNSQAIASLRLKLDALEKTTAEGLLDKQQQLVAGSILLHNKSGNPTIMLDGGAKGDDGLPKLIFFGKMEETLGVPPARMAMRIDGNGDPHLTLYRRYFPGEGKLIPALELRHRNPFSEMFIFDRLGRERLAFEVDGEGNHVVFGKVHNLAGARKN